MQSNYCQSCFKKTTQTIDIVKFCAHCGKPFSEVTSSIAAKPQNVISPPWEYTAPVKELEKRDNRKYREKILSQTRNKRLEDNDEDDIDDDVDDFDGEEDNVRVPNISKLDVEIDIPRNEGQTLKSLAQGAPRKPKQKIKAPKVNQKEFLANFLKSASSLKKR